MVMFGARGLEFRRRTRNRNVTCLGKSPILSMCNELVKRENERDKTQKERKTSMKSFISEQVFISFVRNSL